MRRLAATALLILAACSGSSTDEVTGDTDGTTFEPPPPLTTDTGYPPGGMANFMVAHTVNTGNIAGYAVGTESNPGFVNLSECAIQGTPCLPLLPSTEDDFEDIDTDRELDRTTVDTTYLGLQVKLAGKRMDYFTDPETGFGFYYRDMTDDGWPEGDIGVKFSGQWELYRSDDDHHVSPPIDIQIPQPDANIKFHNGEMVPIEWVPTGTGEVYLTVSTRFDLARLYHLEDDGYFELDVDSLGFGTDTEDLTFNLARWDTTQIRRFGHLVDIVSVSNVYWTGEYFHIGGRDRITPPSSCAEAQGQLSLESGSYWGFLNGSNDLDPTNGCLSGNQADARGADQMVRLEIPGKHSLSLEYNVYDESASVYLVENCNNDDSCFLGADQDPDPNVPEFLNFFNPNEEAEVLYLVLDSTNYLQSIYTLDLNIDPLFDPDFYDTCDEALQNAQTVFSGNYYEDFLGYGPGLNPGTGGCTSSSLPGADMMTPITLDSGQTLAVNVNMPGADPGIYILYNCADEFSCPVGADLSLGSSEQLSYVNQSAGTENLYLVVDSKSGLRPFFMGLSIF